MVERLPHWAEAVRDDAREGWVAQFCAPGVGTQVVKDSVGQTRVYSTRDKAKSAASDAMCAALDFPAKRSLGKRVCRVVGSGRTRVLIPAGSPR